MTAAARGAWALFLAVLLGCGGSPGTEHVFYDQPGIPAFESYLHELPPSRFGFIHWINLDERGAQKRGGSNEEPLTTSRGLEAFRSELEQFQDGGFYETVGVIAPSAAPMRALVEAMRATFEVKGFTRFYLRGRAANEPQHVFFHLLWVDPESLQGRSAVPLSFEHDGGANWIRLNNGPRLSPEEAHREVVLALTDFGRHPVVRLSVEEHVPSGEVLEVLSASSLDGVLRIVTR